MRNKATMTSIGSNTNASGMQVGFVSIGNINNPMILTCWPLEKSREA